jgi:hypothetical protein
MANMYSSKDTISSKGLCPSKKNYAIWIQALNTMVILEHYFFAYHLSIFSFNLFCS